MKEMFLFHLLQSCLSCEEILICWKNVMTNVLLTLRTGFYKRSCIFLLSSKKVIMNKKYQNTAINFHMVHFLAKYDNI